MTSFSCLYAALRSFLEGFKLREIANFSKEGFGETFPCFRAGSVEEEGLETC